MFSNRYLWAFLIIVSIILDIVLKGVAVFGTRVDVAFILVIFAGLSHGFFYGSGIGFAAGMGKDIFSNIYIGPGAFSLTLTGFLAGVFGKNIFYQNILIQTTIVFIATFFKMSSNNFLLLMMHHSPYPARDILSQAFFNAFLTPPIFFLLRAIFKK